ncbi:prolyl-tRNA editing enzyme YbaK/EbsC (Cys-tRNA(Pro) deacylase) [Stackebrandtia endophytica]|uniref:Prolyl-tRNA editing enzyme YbaK/EbsC (Cys-tRNA(Pro) deacylase) n=1 Tax=Stackebrandtia endophytica TaxID=1496996 RepID=A0A543AX08_9ACTN|nr:YbaK/EbsC family protein [Stackebrandtia endophytica]TQL77115.1 prolyl-tRNA editing enzyme YbaK/EbsC (Cys-tRNA(Pro) deacylase) [Stackebrandtia endophytica]
MTWTISGSLTVQPVAASTHLLAGPVKQALDNLPTAEVGVAEIDANLADTAEFCEHYGVPLGASANCVIVAGKRGQTVTYAACLALATTKINVNTVVRKHLDVRKASFAPMSEAVDLTGMEYGGITPIGLPTDWRILLGPDVAEAPELVIGGGIRGSKILVTGRFLASLPGAEVVEGLAG